MEVPIEMNLPNDSTLGSVDIKLGRKLLEESMETELDENGNEVRVLYLDSNYDITTKDNAVYRRIEKV